MTTPVAEIRGSFDALLIEAIDETMVALFSGEVRDGLYQNLLQFHSISKDEVPRNIEILCSILERIFGGPNSKTISRTIAKRFYSKLELQFPKHTSSILTLVNYVDDAKFKLKAGEPPSRV